MSPAVRRGPVLLLTMPGFGIETLRHLARSPQWPRLDVTVALVGERPALWRQLAHALRRACQRPADRIHALADGSLCTRAAQSCLRQLGVPWCWLSNDDAVRQFRIALQPVLTLTLTSRILFSAPTLQEPATDWLNVHPGLLPQYAGASPAPYMFMDGVGGSTVHVMQARVDAGAIIDRAVMAAPLGEDVGEYFFKRLPLHTADQLAALLGHWLDGRPWARPDMPLGKLHHCSRARLGSDRQLDWRLPPEQVARWVRSLAAIAPAWWSDSRHGRTEVMAAAAGQTGAGLVPGTVLRVAGRWVEVACAGGAVALRCRTRPRVVVGQVLPSRPAAPAP